VSYAGIPFLRLHRRKRTHVLYIGVTKNVLRRTDQHREGQNPGFTADYRCNRLVWFERYQYVENANDREQQIKRWSRAKKIMLLRK
jgi:putative endonuclease